MSMYQILSYSAKDLHAFHWANAQEFFRGFTETIISAADASVNIGFWVGGCAIPIEGLKCADASTKPTQ